MRFDPKRAEEHANDMRRTQQDLRAQGKGARPGLLGTGMREIRYDRMSPTKEIAGSTAAR